MIEENLTKYLNDSLEIPEAVFYWEALSGYKKYVVIRQVSPVKFYSHSGYDKMQRPRIQIDCYAPDKIEAKQMSREVEQALYSWDNAHGVEHENENPTREEEANLYRISNDYFIGYYDKE